MTRYTCLEIANKLEVDKDTANHLIRVLQELGLAQYKGERPNENRRGKGQYVYEIAPGAGKIIAAAVRKLES